MVWYMVLACLMWFVWKEQNRRTFEDMGSSLDQLKTLFACTTFDWSCIWGLTHFSSILEFQVSLKFSFWDVCTFLTLCVHHHDHKVYLIINKVTLLTYQKKRVVNDILEKFITTSLLNPPHLTKSTSNSPYYKYGDIGMIESTTSILTSRSKL